MTWRRDELSRFGDSLAWLPREEAVCVYTDAMSKTSKERYGLDERFWEIVARLDVDDISDHEASAELARLLPTEEFFLIFSREDVARVARPTFLSHWRSMFLPSRDDVVIIPAAADWCLFYCHEDEFEFGRKNEPNKAPEPTPGPVTSHAVACLAPVPVVAHL